MKPVRSICLLFAFAACVVACGDGESRTRSAISSDLTLDEVYALMEEAVAGEGDVVLHALLVPESIDFERSTEEHESDLAEEFALHREELWIDAPGAVVRHESRNQDQSDDEVRTNRSLLVGDQLFYVEHNDQRGELRKPPLCGGTNSLVLAQLLRCSESEEGATTDLKSAERDGDEVFVIVTTGEIAREDAVQHHERLLYVDPDSHLPTAIEGRSMTRPADASEDTAYSVVYRYDIDFVQRSSLADDFFEPYAIGYAEFDSVPANAMPRDVNGMRVYWLGTEFDAGLSQPLRVERANVFSGTRAPEHNVSLAYRPEDAVDRYRGVSILQYAAGHPIEMTRGFELYWTRDDIVRTDTTISGTPARIYRDEKGPEVRLRAHVYFETTIVVVEDYIGAPPYTGEAAFMRVVEGLHPFEP